MDVMTAAILITLVGCLLQLNLCEGFNAPIICAPLVGIILGDPLRGVELGAELQLIFMGATAIGAAVPPNAVVGTMIATAVVIMSGQTDAAAALTLAIPVAVAGQSLNILNRALCTFIQHWADSLINRKKYNGVDWANYIGGLSKFLMFPIIFFPAVYFGADAVEGIMSVIPQWMLHGLEVAGGMLPIVGFGMLLKYLNIKHLFPFFFIGFALATFGNFSMIGVTIVAVCIALVLDYYTNHFTIGGGSLTPVAAGNAVAMPTDDLDALMEDDDDDMDTLPVTENKMVVTESDNTNEETKREIKKIVKKRDLVRAFFRCFLLQICWNFERMQALGFCYCMVPVLKKLYKNQPEKLHAAIERHNVFFNSNPVVTPFILGTTMAMEENVAGGGDVDEDTINTVKISLMGPLAGIGDSLIFFTLVPIMQLICCNLIINGNYVGPIIYIITVAGASIVLRWLFIDRGYKLGVDFIDKLSSGVMQRVVSIATIVGLMVVGVMTATMVKCPLTLTIGAGEKAQTLGAILDGFMPNLLPLIFTLLSFWLIKKGVNPVWILLGVIVVCCLAALVGIC